MLGKRYKNDGKPTLKLNDLQMAVKEKVNLKVEDKIYPFEKVPCAICNEHDFEELSEKDRYGLYMPVVVCKQCGLIQTNPRMTQESYAAFYNEEYRKLYGGSEKPSEAFLIKQYGQGRKIFNYVLPFLSEKKPDEQWYVLEIGCGAGGILKYFHDQGCRVTGVDLGDEYIQYGVSEYGLDLRTGTLQNLQLDRSPDLIIYSHVLEHILTPEDELKLVHKQLVDGGMLYVELPGVRNLSGSYRLDFLRMLQNAHVYHFTLNTLNQLLTKAKFKLVIGDETIRSLFSKAEKNTTDKINASNDYPSITHFLRRMEIFRILGPVIPSVLISNIRKTLVKILQKLGIYAYVKKVVWSIIK